jgi:hypothetical protein
MGVRLILCAILIGIGFMLSYRSAKRGRGFIAYLTGFLGIVLASGVIFIADVVLITNSVDYGGEYVLTAGVLCAPIVPAIGLYMGRRELKNEQQRAKA